MAQTLANDPVFLMLCDEINDQVGSILRELRGPRMRPGARINFVCICESLGIVRAMMEKAAAKVAEAPPPSLPLVWSASSSQSATVQLPGEGQNVVEWGYRLLTRIPSSVERSKWQGARVGIGTWRLMVARVEAVCQVFAREVA